MEYRSARARQRYESLVEAATRSVVCLDFDGVLSPIVPDPAEAHIHPAGPDTLVALADQVKAVAVITGRPARQAVALGGLDEVGTRVAAAGRELLVLGQYGNERWSAHDRRVLSPRPPRGLAILMAELPDLLRGEGLGDAFLEEKSLAVAVHTRRLPDPDAALAALQPVLARAAAEHQLVLEPGRMVIEIRAPGMDKGQAVRKLQKELRADAIMYIGDDLGDIEAFKAVAALRTAGMVGLLVCSGSEDESAMAELADQADLVVDGPDGVMTLLRHFTEDCRTAHQVR